MPAQRGDARGLDAADAPADDRDLLCLLCGRDGVFAAVHGLRVERTARHMLGVGERLVVRRALVVRHCKAGIVAADTGLNVLGTPFHEFGDPRAVRQELPRDAHGVDLSVAYRIRADFRLHAARTDDRDIHKLFDVCHIVQVAVLGHVCRRVRPVPGVVCAVVRVEHVVARILQIFCSLFTLRHIPPGFDIVLAGHCANAEADGLTDDRIAQRHGVFFPAFGFDRLHDIRCKPIAVFKTSAVFVCALIGVGRCELIHQISFMYGVDLHAIHARLFAKTRRFGKGVDHMLDFFLSERAHLDVLRPTRRQL